jgi:hypothetical protein
MEAISNAGAAVGILATDGVVLAAEKRITSKVTPPKRPGSCPAVRKARAVARGRPDLSALSRAGTNLPPLLAPPSPPQRLSAKFPFPFSSHCFTASTSSNTVEYQPH